MGVDIIQVISTRNTLTQFCLIYISMYFKEIKEKGPYKQTCLHFWKKAQAMCILIVVFVRYNELLYVSTNVLFINTIQNAFFDEKQYTIYFNKLSTNDEYILI